MGDTDVHRPGIEGPPAERAVHREQLLHRRRLGDRHIVEDAQSAEHDRREEQPGQVDRVPGELADHHDLLGPLRRGEPGEGGHHGRQDAGDQEPGERAHDRRERRSGQALGQHERNDRHQGTQPDRQRERVPTGEQERDEHADREDERQREGHQRPDPAPARDRDGDQGEDERQPADERQPPAVDHREGRGAVGLAVDRDHHLIADGVVGQLELAGRSFEVGGLAFATSWALDELDGRGWCDLAVRGLQLHHLGVDPLGNQALGRGRAQVGQQDEDRGDREEAEREQDDLAVGSTPA